MKTIIRLEFEENQPASSYIRRVNDTESCKTSERRWVEVCAKIRLERKNKRYKERRYTF